MPKSGGFFVLILAKYIYIYMCVCVCVWFQVGDSQHIIIGNGTGHPSSNLGQDYLAFTLC